MGRTGVFLTTVRKYALTKGTSGSHACRAVYATAKDCLRSSIAFRSNCSDFVDLDDELGLGARAARLLGVGVARELDLVVVLQLQRALEAPSNLRQRLLALLRSPGLAVVRLGREGFARATGPEADTVEASSNVHDDTHHFVVVFVLKVLADGCEHDVQPEGVDVDCLLFLELESPLSSVLVLLVFPLGSDALLEQVVVGLECEVGCGCDVVLSGVSAYASIEPAKYSRRCPRTPRPSQTR